MSPKLKLKKHPLNHLNLLKKVSSIPLPTTGAHKELTQFRFIFCNQVFFESDPSSAASLLKKTWDTEEMMKRLGG